MAKCLNEDCSNKVVSQEGKRAKKFCSNSCRQRTWQKSKQEDTFIKVKRSDWEKLVQGVPERQNPLINAARGRDKNGINEDEVRISSKIGKKVEFRDKMDGESGLDYSIAKREFLNNQ